MGAGGSAVTVNLDEQNGSGESGTATLTPVSSTSTKVVVELSNPPSDPQPAHIHPGTCANLDPTPKYALPNIVDGKVEATVPVGLEQLQAGEFALNVHKSELRSRSTSLAEIFRKARSLLGRTARKEGDSLPRLRGKVRRARGCQA